MKIKITKIRLDGGTQPRAMLDETTINNYCEDIENDAIMPPVEVCYDGTDYWLWDGFHRVHANKKAGNETIEANVSQGTRRDAVLKSVGVNAEHGLRRTNADKKQAVMTLLNDDEWVQWSDREIARRCKVSHKTVSKYRPSVSGEFPQIRKVERAGTVYTQDTKNIGSIPVKPALLPSTPEHVRDAVDSGEVSINDANEMAFHYTGMSRDVTDKLAAIPSGKSLEEVKAVSWLTRNKPEKVDEIIDKVSTGDIKSVNEAMRKDAYIGMITNIGSSKSNEWYTPAKYIESARTVMGGFDVDPASNDMAQETIKATTYYTIETNGLDKEWHGRIWLNPPYGDENRKFIAKLIEEVQSGRVIEAVVLVNSHSTDTRWFQPLWDYTLCFTNHRINFISPDEEAKTGSNHGSVFVYIGSNTDRFADEFSQYGAVVQKYIPKDIAKVA